MCQKSKWNQRFHYDGMTIPEIPFILTNLVSKYALLIGKIYNYNLPIEGLANYNTKNLDCWPVHIVTYMPNNKYKGK